MISFSVFAKETPFDEFSMETNFTNEVKVTLMPVDNVQATCQRESKRRGYDGMPLAPGKKIDACSFWKEIAGQDTCVVIVSKTKVTYWNLGHEMRHCVQGRFH